MRIASKAEATDAIRTMFGPTARLKRVSKAGLEGVQVLARNGVAFQTFDMAGDVWRRCVRACIPLWLSQEARR